MLGSFSKLLHRTVRILSAEFMLTWPHRRANGGTLIFARTLWVSLLLYFLTLLAREILDPLSTWQLDAKELRHAIHDTIPWFGAFYAAVYTALYARFSSQWTYLAGLYNQIMAAMSRPDHDEGVLSSWQAAFIEDAEELHLALKPMYAELIRSWAAEDRVRTSYVREVPGGSTRLSSLLEDIGRVETDIQSQWNKNPTPLPNPAPTAVDENAPGTTE